MSFGGGASPLLFGMGLASFNMGAPSFGDTGAWLHRRSVGERLHCCLAWERLRSANRGCGFIVVWRGSVSIAARRGVGAASFGNTGAWLHRRLVGEHLHCCLAWLHCSSTWEQLRSATRGRGFIVVRCGSGSISFGRGSDFIFVGQWLRLGRGFIAVWRGRSLIDFGRVISFVFWSGSGLIVFG